MSIDGCIAGPNGEMDWMVGLFDDEVLKYVNKITERRKIAPRENMTWMKQ